MTPREKRERLFKRGKPHIRHIELYDEDGYGRDMAILWLAYKDGSFHDMPEYLTQDQVADFFTVAADGFQKGWIIEDKTKRFAEGYGPVGFMMAAYNGWELEPHYEAFGWASKRNTLSAVVSFLQMMRYDKDIGIVNVNTVKKDKAFFRHVTGYDVLKYATKIPHGDVSGDRYIFYLRGNKKWAA